MDGRSGLGYVPSVAEAPRRDQREIARLVALVLTLVVLLALLLDNRHEVRIGYVVGEADAPLLVVLLVAAALGALADRLFLWRRRRATRR